MLAQSQALVLSVSVCEWVRGGRGEWLDQSTCLLPRSQFTQGVCWSRAWSAAAALTKVIFSDLYATHTHITHTHTLHTHTLHTNTLASYWVKYCADAADSDRLLGAVRPRLWSCFSNRCSICFLPPWCWTNVMIFTPSDLESQLAWSRDHRHGPISALFIATVNFIVTFAEYRQKVNTLTLTIIASRKSIIGICLIQSKFWFLYLFLAVLVNVQKMAVQTMKKTALKLLAVVKSGVTD